MRLKEPSRENIWEMFDKISPSYDKVNHVISFGMHQRLRKKLATYLPEKKNLRLLDLATGTGDQIAAILDETDAIDEAIGIDPAKKMLYFGKEKMREKFYDPKVKLIHGSAETLPFKDASFDIITMSFGIRNVQDLEKTLKEAKRVLKKGGRFLILEFSLPEKCWIRRTYLLYLRIFMPFVGGILSGNYAAYRYLHKTISTFPSGESFIKLLEKSGWKAEATPLLLGTTHLYVAVNHD